MDALRPTRGERRLAVFLRANRADERADDRADDRADERADERADDASSNYLGSS